MKKRHFKNQLLAWGTLTVLLFGFQNCSQSELDFVDLESELLKSEFNYNYESKPAHFLQTLILLKPEPNPSNEFDVKVYVGSPLSVAPVGNVRVEVSDDQDRPLCITQNLDVSSGQTEWTINCVPPFQFSTAVIRLTLTGTGGDYVTEKSYTFD